jgi:dTDP-4-dehydrorhamnose reductase
MTWVVLGANGQLGQELIQLLNSLKVEVVGINQTQIDLAKPEQIYEKLAALKPKVLVNCAAYTQVDKAEEEAELANVINGTSVGVIAQYAIDNFIPFVHISTDYVFDGQSEFPYTELDQPNPQSVYGKSKLLGEEEVLRINPTAYILRTAWVYGAYGNNFPKIIANKLRNNETLKVVNDQIGSPTWTYDLANAIFEVIQKRPKAGIYHTTNNEQCSWFDFAKQIARSINIDENNIQLTDSNSFKRPAPRPKFSVLNNEKWKNAGLTPLCSWDKAWGEAADSVLKNN